MHKISSKTYWLSIGAFSFVMFACSTDTDRKSSLNDTSVVIVQDDSVLFSEDLFDSIPKNVDSGTIYLSQATCQDAVCKVPIPVHGGAMTLNDLQSYFNTFDGRIEIKVSQDNSQDGPLPDQMLPCRPWEYCTPITLASGQDPQDASAGDVKDIAQGPRNPYSGGLKTPPASELQYPTLDLTPYLTFEIPPVPDNFGPYIKQQQEAADKAIGQITSQPDAATTGIILNWAQTRSANGQAYADFRKQAEELLQGAEASLSRNAPKETFDAAEKAMSEQKQKMEDKKRERTEAHKAARNDLPKEIPSGYNNLRSSPDSRVGQQIRSQFVHLDYLEANEKVMTAAQRSNLQLAKDALHTADMASEERSEAELNNILALARIYAEIAEGKIKPEPRSKFDWPLANGGQGRVTTKFGVIDASHPKPHGGTDIAVPVKTPVASPVHGVVKTVGKDPRGYGQYIVIEHLTVGNQVHDIIMGHLTSDSTLAPGTYVSAGQVVGLSGNTGRSTGPHLHLEIRDCTGINNCNPLRRPTKGGPPRVDPTGWLF